MALPRRVEAGSVRGRLAERRLRRLPRLRAVGGDVVDGLVYPRERPQPRQQLLAELLAVLARGHAGLLVRAVLPDRSVSVAATDDRQAYTCSASRRRPPCVSAYTFRAGPAGPGSHAV